GVFYPAEDGIRDFHVTGVQTCALPIFTLRDALEAAGTLDQVGGAAVIASLTDGVPKTANVEHYARIVRDKALIRAVRDECRRLRSEARRVGKEWESKWEGLYTASTGEG